MEKDYKKTIGRNRGIATLAIFCSIFSNESVSQSLQEIELTSKVASANKEETYDLNTPAAIGIINSTNIYLSGPQVNLSESLSKISGITTLNRQNYVNDLQISIRGFGSRAQYGIKGIRLIVDGIPSSLPDGQGQAGTAALTSTEKIEVLKGPLAQFYGNAAGGVISVFTEKAISSRPVISPSLYIGSDNMVRTDLKYSQKFDSYGIVFDYNTFETNGFRNNSQAKKEQLNVKFDYETTPRTQNSTILNYYNQPYAYDPRGLSLIDALTNPRLSYVNPNNKLRKITEQIQVGHLLEYKATENQTLFLGIYAGNRKNTQFRTEYLGPTSPAKYSQFDRDYYGINTSITSNITIGNIPAKWQNGFTHDYMHDINIDGKAENGEFSSTPLIYAKDYRRAYNTDGFTKLDLLFDKITVTGGFRLSTVTLKSDSQLSGLSIGNLNYHNSSPILGVSYLVNNNLNLYANYGKGFETPSIIDVSFQRSGNVNINQFNSSLAATESQQYEIGTKWRGSNTKVNLSMFSISSKNETITDLSFNGSSSYRNLPNGINRKGAEVELTHYIQPSLKISGAVSYLTAKFNEAYAGSGASSTNITNNNVPGIPQTTSYLELVWSESSFMLNKHKKITGAVLGVEVISRSKIYADDLNLLGAPGYMVSNFKSAYNFNLNENSSITLYGQLNNLFDKAYIGSLLVGNAKPFEPAPGRNWVVGATANLTF